MTCAYCPVCNLNGDKTTNDYITLGEVFKRLELETKFCRGNVQQICHFSLLKGRFRRGGFLSCRLRIELGVLRSRFHIGGRVLRSRLLIGRGVLRNHFCTVRGSSRRGRGVFRSCFRVGGRFYGIIVVG